MYHAIHMLIGPSQHKVEFLKNLVWKKNAKDGCPKLETFSQ